MTDINYDGKTLAKQTTFLAKHYPSAQEPAEALEEQEMKLFTPCNVMLLEAKTLRAKRILCNFIEKTATPITMKPLSYDFKNEESTRVPTEYLKIAITFLDIGFESVDIQQKSEYPTTLENDDWRFIIAPRIKTN